jgi:triacylglycerol lipase
MSWPIVLVVVLGLAVAGVPLLTFAFYWYETANGPHLDYLAMASGGRPCRWLARGVLWGVLSTFLVVVFYPLALVRTLWRPKPDAGSPGPAIVLIHGIYHNASGWLIFRHRLKRAGFANVYAISYSSFMTSFDKTLGKVERFVAQTSARLPGKPVVLIGHSMGGLLARALEQRSKNPEAVAAVITLGSPHRGSKLAVLGPGALAQSLRYKGPLFDTLAQSSPASDCPRFALYSLLDNMVLPFDSLLPPAAGWTGIETGPVSHVSMLYSKPVFKKVLDCIREAMEQGRAGKEFS